MKVIIPQVDAPTTTVCDLLTPRSQVTRLKLASYMMRAWNELPIHSPTTRALVLLLQQAGRTTGSSKASLSLWSRLETYSLAYRAIIDYLTLHLLAEAKSLSRDVLNGEMTSATFLTGSGLQALIDKGTLTLDDVMQISLYARRGSGPNYSQRDVLKLIRSLVTMEPPSIVGCNIVDDYEKIREHVMYTRLLELALGLFESGERVASTETTTVGASALADRIVTIREVGGVFALTRFAAAATIAAHTQTWFRHPFVTAVTSGRIGEELTRAFDEITARRVATSTVPSWPELETAKLIDYRFCHPWPDLSRLAPPVRELPRDLNVGHPLTSEMTFNVHLLPTALSGATDVVWRATEEVIAARAIVDYVTDGDVAAARADLRPITVDLAWFSGEPATQRTVMAEEIPLVHDCIPRVIWNVDSDNLSYLTAHPTMWQMHTYAAVRDYIATHTTAPKTDLLPATYAEDAKWIPVRVTGDTDAPIVTHLQLPIPWNWVHDSGTMRVPMTRDGLFQFWGLSPWEMHETVRSWTGRPDSAEMRAFAELVRFIGIVRITQEVDGVHVVRSTVQPYQRLWYHAREVSLTACLQQDQKEWVLLGEKTVTLGAPDVLVRIYLQPFTSIPCSAVAADLVANQRQIPSAYDSERNRPLIHWEYSGDRPCAPGSAIQGWQLSEQPLRDIVLVRTLPDPGAFQPVHVRSDATGHWPTWMARYNAIIWLQEPTPQSEVGVTMPAPRPWIHTM